MVAADALLACVRDGVEACRDGRPVVILGGEGRLGLLQNNLEQARRTVG